MSFKQQEPSFVLLVRSLGVGGTERQVVTLAEGLHREGVVVRVVCFYGGGPLEAGLRDLSIPVIDIGKKGRYDFIGFAVRLVKCIRAAEADVVYGFLDGPAVACIFASPLTGADVLWGVRSAEMDLALESWFFKLVYRNAPRLSRFASAVVCNSEAARRHAITRGFRNRRLVVIPNGIDVGTFVRRSPGDEADLFARTGAVVGWVGRLHRGKNADVFIEAAACLAATRTDARFVCIGDGDDDYRRELQGLAQRKGIMDKLEFAGARADMASMLSMMDVLVNTSRGESFPNVVGEAMACGVPCVTTDVGDASVIVGDTGRVVPIGDVPAVARAVADLLDELNRGDDLRRRARQRIVDEYSVDRLVARTLDVAREVRTSTRSERRHGRGRRVRLRRAG